MDRVALLETVRARQIGELSRRDFLAKAGAMLGSSAAALTLLSACAANEGNIAAPVVDESAGPIEAGQASEGGLTTGVVEYPYQDETLMGYLAYQTAADPRPIVIVLQEWWGSTTISKISPIAMRPKDISPSRPISIAGSSRPNPTKPAKRRPP